MEEKKDFKEEIDELFEMLKFENQLLRQQVELGKIYHIERQKKYRKNNKEKIREYVKNYNEKNKEKIREYNKNYYQTNKDKKNENQRKYYQKNKKRIRLKHNLYYQTNKDKFKKNIMKRKR